jgi:hypothetical protein
MFTNHLIRGQTHRKNSNWINQYNSRCYVKRSIIFLNSLWIRRYVGPLIFLRKRKKNRPDEEAKRKHIDRRSIFLHCYRTTQDLIDEYLSSFLSMYRIGYENEIAGITWNETILLFSRELFNLLNEKGRIAHVPLCLSDNAYRWWKRLWNQWHTKLRTDMTETRISYLRMVFLFLMVDLH